MNCLLYLLTFLLSFATSAGTITFADLGLENGIQYSNPFDGGDFAVTFTSGANYAKNTTPNKASAFMVSPQ